MSGSLAGKTAFVTGAGSGIGLAIADIFCSNGIKVVGLDLPGKPVPASLIKRVSAWIEGDVSAPGIGAVIAAKIKDTLGKLDILVNNAGVCLPGTVEDVSDEIWDKTLAINVSSIFRITRALLPLMKSTGAGRIINLGSIMSDMAGPGLAAYGTSKHAVAGLTKAMAVDLGQYHITANYLQPGCIVTGLSEPMLADPAFNKYWEEKAPAGRLGLPGDVAAVALFLAGDASAFMTGTGINIDGGAIVKF